MDQDPRRDSFKEKMPKPPADGLLRYINADFAPFDQMRKCGTSSYLSTPFLRIAILS